MTIWLDTCASTNAELGRRAAELPHLAVVATHEQTAGRGQRGNTWEAAPGQNLTFSMLLRQDGFPPGRQFELSEAVALGVADAIALLLPGHNVRVKWPNDIYAGDRKICGILIEHVLSPAGIDYSIAGIGINVNQTSFVSDAPNPVSLRMLTSNDYPLEPLLETAVKAIAARLAQPPGPRHSDYIASLWRRDGGTWEDAHTGERFTARTGGVAPDGTLTLIEASGRRRSYLFKQVRAIL